jgi:hypothetical protein
MERMIRDMSDSSSEIERLRAERDKWVEYVTCDRAQLVLALEAALARAEKAEVEIERLRAAVAT